MRRPIYTRLRFSLASMRIGRAFRKAAKAMRKFGEVYERCTGQA